MPRIDASRLAGGKRKVKSFAYTCSRNTLAAINTIFIFIGLILIGVAAYGKKQNMLVSLPALGGVIACGVFLLLIAIVGLIGAIRHNQIILFFYMIIMSLLFIVLLACSVAALAVTEDQRRDLIQTAWKKAPVEAALIEKTYNCCGLTKVSDTCKMKSNTPCYESIKEPLDRALSVSGGVGLFFSFSLLLAVYLTVRFRNQKDPRSNADAFL
eukprot:TCONS_00025713-protein